MIYRRMLIRYRRFFFFISGSVLNIGEIPYISATTQFDDCKSTLISSSADFCSKKFGFSFNKNCRLTGYRRMLRLYRRLVMIYQRIFLGYRRLIFFIGGSECYIGEMPHISSTMPYHSLHTVSRPVSVRICARVPFVYLMMEGAIQPIGNDVCHVFNKGIHFLRRYHQIMAER